MVKKSGKDTLLMMMRNHRPLVRTLLKRREAIKSAQHMNERYWNKKVSRLVNLYGPAGVFEKIRKSK